MLRLLQYNLAKTGCQVMTATSGQETLEIIGSTPVDLLIIDIMMPGIDGFQTIEQLRNMEAGKDLPVIVLTGRGQSNTQDQADSLQVAGFLTKPFSPTRLLQTVLDVLQQSGSA